MSPYLQQKMRPWELEAYLGQLTPDLLERDEATERLLVETWKEASTTARHYEVLRSSTSQIFLGLAAAVVAFFINQKMQRSAEYSAIAISGLGGALTLYFHEAHVWQWFLARGLQTILLQGKVVKEPKDRADTYLNLRNFWWEQYKRQHMSESLKLEPKFLVEHCYVLVHLVLIFVAGAMILVKAL